MPTAGGWAVLASGAAAFTGACMLGRVDLLVFGLFLLLVPLASMLTLVLARPRLAVERTVDGNTVAVGDEIDVRLAVRNLGRRATPALIWRDAAPGGLAVPDPARMPPLARRPPGSRDYYDHTSMSYRLRGAHRGVHRLGPLILRRHDPFRLARVDTALGPSRVVRVVPRVIPLEDTGPHAAENGGLDEAVAHARNVGADELTVRDYQPGDPLRRIHWRTTARHGTLMVRREEELGSPGAWILIDTVTGGEGPGSAVQESALERRIELGASLAAHLLARGFTLGIAETGARGTIVGASDGRDDASRARHDSEPLERVLVGLAEICGHDEIAADWADQLADALKANRSAIPAFAILGDASARSAPGLARLGAGFGPAVAFLDGPATGAEPLLSAAGWALVHVGAHDTPARAWQRATQEWDGVLRK